MNEDFNMFSNLAEVQKFKSQFDELRKLDDNLAGAKAEMDDN